jgi:hypothetical protein
MNPPSVKVAMYTRYIHISQPANVEVQGYAGYICYPPGEM